jgi:hypothetical protein
MVYVVRRIVSCIILDHVFSVVLSADADVFYAVFNEPRRSSVSYTDADVYTVYIFYAVCCRFNQGILNFFI